MSAQAIDKTQISAADNQNDTTILLFLDPNSIVTPEITNVRPFTTGDTEDEIDALEKLAATIEAEGQLQPGKVRFVKQDDAENGGYYELIAGRRRMKAIQLINAGRKTGQEMKFKAILDVAGTSDPSAFRQAVIENLHRKGMSPMEMAANIATVRENFKWQGSKVTKKVADFFKVSTATITQYELLLKLPEELQKKVNTGDVSRDDAFKLSVIADKQGPDAAIKALEEGEQAGAEAAEEAKAAKKKGVKKAAASAKRKTIAEKAREAGGKSAPRSKGEILEFFEGQQGPAYGYPNGAVHVFVDNLKLYAKGEITSRTLDKYFNAMVEKAPRGHAVAEEESTTKKKAAKAANKK